VNHDTEQHSHEYSEPSQARLSTSAIVHCLAGCGLGEVVGVVIGVALGLTNVEMLVLAVILGPVLGFAGMRVDWPGVYFPEARRQWGTNG
jgi:hypothetical protein